jgi:hypothetical protein
VDLWVKGDYLKGTKVMAITFAQTTWVLFKTSDAPGYPAGSRHQVACGEGDIHQGGVFEDG